METLKNLNKLWRSSALLPTPGTLPDSAEKVSDEAVDVDEEEVEVEEEESFFELELVMQSCYKSETTAAEKEKSSKEGSSGSQGRRVVPIESNLKQQSPVSILKSAPKFKVSLFRKPKAEQVVNRVACVHTDSDLKRKVDEVDDAATISTLIKENISSGPKALKQSIHDDSSLPADSSKRFSKDVMQKYLKLKLIKPFHLRVAKRSESLTKSKLFDAKESPASSSPACEKLKLKSDSSPAGGFRVVCKQLGKSRSASSMSSVAVSVSVGGGRRDESLLDHDDGIQSAILHCKRSFNSSRDSSMLSSKPTQKSAEQLVVVV